MSASQGGVCAVGREDTGDVTPNGVTVGCFAAFVIEEAKKGGFGGFAGKLEECLAEFLLGLPKDERREALIMSYQLATAGLPSRNFQLRLVHSRP